MIASHIRSTTTALNGTPIGMLLTAAGYLSVAFFFFVSGYGLSIRFQSKGEDYLARFPVRRILSFYIKYLLFTVAYFAVAAIIGVKTRSNFTYKTLLMLDWNIYNGWYLQAIMLSYLLFFLVKKLLHHSVWLDGLVIFLLYVLIYRIPLEGNAIFYQSYPAMLLGLLMPLFEEKFRLLLSKKSGFLLALAADFVLFCVMVLLGNTAILPQIPRLLCKMLSAPLFVVLVLLISSVIFVQNKVTAFLGKVSFEIYVFHGLFIAIFLGRLEIHSYLLLIPLVYCSSLLLSAAFHPLLQLTDKILTKLNCTEKTI